MLYQLLKTAFTVKSGLYSHGHHSGNTAAAKVASQNRPPFCQFQSYSEISKTGRICIEFAIIWHSVLKKRKWLELAEIVVRKSGFSRPFEWILHLQRHLKRARFGTFKVAFLLIWRLHCILRWICSYLDPNLVQIRWKMCEILIVKVL